VAGVVHMVASPKAVQRRFMLLPSVIYNRFINSMPICVLKMICHHGSHSGW